MKNFFSILILFVGTLLCNADHMNWNAGRGYKPFNYATAEGILIDNPTDTLKHDYYKFWEPVVDFSLRFRSKNLSGNPSKRYSYTTRSGRRISLNNPHWGFFITCQNDTIIFSAKSGEKKSANESDPCLNLSIYKLNKTIKEEVSINKNINPYDGENLWEIKVENGYLNLLGGDTSLKELFETEINSKVTGFGFFAGWGDKILISDISAEYQLESGIINQNLFEGVGSYLQDSEDSMEGYWTLFDRELEESLLKLGGRYILLCLKDEDGYKFFYLEGASINSNNWEKGDVKAILTPTPFADIYEVEWFDSMKVSMSHDIKAQLGEGETMTIQFPYQSSKLRLRKIPSSYNLQP